MEQEDFLAALNEAQRAAVVYNDGPQLILAGAGAGKTRVLTSKIAWLLSQGVAPQSIMALTFTNKAAREMNERIASMIDTERALSYSLWSGTFHSIFSKLLRMEHDPIGYPVDYTIYDAADQRSLIKQIVKDLSLDEKIYKPSLIASRISRAKNQLLLPQLYLGDAKARQRDEVDNIPQVGRIYQIYQQRLFEGGVMDFDDLLLQTFLLLTNHPDVAERYRNRFQYILVDEYQDTNMAQYRILRLLTSPTSSICVVGDDAQSIYGFRGADITNILMFQQQYPTARVFKLECNYRSTSCIVEAANSVICHNVRQLPKKVYANGPKGDPILCYGADTDRGEARFVRKYIGELHANHVPYNEMAILYRTNAQSRSFEEAFQEVGIPYRIYGGLSFYQRKEIKDFIAYLRMALNPCDDVSLLRVINTPARGIGLSTIQRLRELAKNSQVSLWHIISNPDTYASTLSARPQKMVKQFADTVNGCLQIAASDNSPLQQAIQILTVSGMEADLRSDDTSQGETRRENIEELFAAMRAYEDETKGQTEEMPSDGQSEIAPSLYGFLSSIALLTDTEEKEDDTPKVTLMTIHAAKGLEFDTVFITGLEDNLFPNPSSKLYPSEMEEERRLFYVAITRAKRHLFFSYARQRFKFGTVEDTMPSPFLSEVANQYVRMLSSERIYPSYKKSKPWQSKSNIETGHQNREVLYGHSVPAPQKHGQGGLPQGVRVGCHIIHDRFGHGSVISIEDHAENTKITVSFSSPGVGTKKLLVKFAKFQVVES